MYSATEAVLFTLSGAGNRTPHFSQERNRQLKQSCCRPELTKWVEMLEAWFWKTDRHIDGKKSQQAPAQMGGIRLAQGRQLGTGSKESVTLRKEC